MPSKREEETFKHVPKKLLHLPKLTKSPKICGNLLPIYESFACQTFESGEQIYLPTYHDV